MGTRVAEHQTSFSVPITVRRYLYLSSLLGIFSALLSIYVGSTIYFFYLVMLFNLLFIWAFIGPLVLPKWLCWFLLYLSASGAIGVFRGTDTTFLVAKQLAVIGLSALYFANFFNLEGNKIDRAWSTYCKLAYWFSILALVILPVQCLVAHGIVRLQGIASEPAKFCVLVLPAWYWHAHLWTKAGTNRKETIWIALALAASVSSLGYLGVALGLFFLFTTRISLKTLIAPAVIVGLMVGIYAVSTSFRIRVDDTVTALINSDVSGTNLSTYALVSNAFVTMRVLDSHPFLGNGLGSHVLSNERYIGDVPGVENMADVSWDIGANTHEAASLTLRSLSELGLAGFVGILWFIYHFRVRGSGVRAAISKAILLVFFEKLLRGGGYSDPEQFFFIVVYMLNFGQSKRERRGVKTVSGASRFTSLIPNSAKVDDRCISAKP